MEATSIDGLVAHCQGARFTGILRVRAREGIGEVWFLSGIADEVHFGVSTADEAMDRLRNATEPMYELVSRLPHPAGGFKRSFPSKGSVATATPVTLMRYCERYALTCTLLIESSDVLIEAKYELGELVSVETTADDDAITAMLEAKEGTYEFTLPRIELPAGTPVLPPTSLSESLPPPDSLGFRALLEAKPLAGRPVSDEAEVKRKTVEIARHKKAATPPPAEKPAPEIAAKKEARPTPVKTEAPAPAPTPASPKAESLPRQTPVTRSVPPRPAAKVETRTDPIKEDAKPAPADPIKEDTKPAAVAPPAEDTRDTRDDEHAAAAKEEPAPARPSKPRKKKRRAASTPPKATPPAKRSLTWLVVPLLCAVALAYLVLTHRI